MARRSINGSDPQSQVSAEESRRSGLARRGFLGGALATTGVLAAGALSTSPAYAETREATSQAPGAKRYTSLPNGQKWYDTDGNPIQAYGAGFLKQGDTFYWVGGDMSTSPDVSTTYVWLYKSTDLMNWTKVGALVTTETQDVNGNKPLGYCNIERPKLLYNAKTKKYVLWMHWEMALVYDASEVMVATADKIEGPYTITAQGHRRPGFGNSSADAMGDRVGELVLDYDTTPKVSTNTNHSYAPVIPNYPPLVQQYNTVTPGNPPTATYQSGDSYGALELDDWWTYELSSVPKGDTTLKARTVVMTAWDDSAYLKYSPDFNVNPANYIVRYPTTRQSAVTSATYKIADQQTSRLTLVDPVISPGLDESTSTTVVLVNANDAAFVTVQTDGASTWYTLDGSDPTDTSNPSRKQYNWGDRIVLTGAAGATTTIKACATLNGQTSGVVTQTYQIAADPTQVPVFKPVFTHTSGTYDQYSEVFGYENLHIFCPTYGAEVYYTMDGNDPNPPMKGDNIGYRSRDMTVWQDPKTGTGYLVTASDDVFMRVWQLTDDFTDVVPQNEYDIFIGQHREAPALVRNGESSGTYVYLLTSYQSSWDPNQQLYARTKDLSAGFSLPRDSTGYRNGESVWSSLQPVGDSTCFGSQTCSILNIGTDSKPQYIYAGDRYVTWVMSESTFVWMPLTIDDNAPSEQGQSGSGLMTLEFQPYLRLSVRNGAGTVVRPSWELLSLKKPVTATASVALTAAEQAAGTYNYSAEAANDGIDYDLSVYDTIEQYYQPKGGQFFWQVDLGSPSELSWIGLSFKDVGGSDTAYRYTITGSTDGQHWTQLVDNTANLRVGFQHHDLSGRYRYVRLNNYSVYDVDHNKEADWAVGVYEISVYGTASS